MGTWLLIGLATCLVLASVVGGAGATRLHGDPSSSQHPAHTHTHSPPCPHPAASSVPTTTSLLKPDYEIITELPKPKPGFYLNKQFQQKKAATTSRANIEAREKVFETKVGTFKLFEPRKPKPGYYLNRQFQKKTQITKEEVKKTPRKVVDDSGRYWTVAELPEPEAGYYLNKQFQRRRVFPVQDLSVKSDAKVQVFLLTSTEAPLVKVPPTTLPLLTESPAINFGHTASTGTSRDANFYNVFSVPETRRRPSGDVQQPFAQQVPSREETKSSIPSGRESSAPEDDNEAADIRAGFGRPSTLAQLLLREDASAKLDTESPAVTAQQPQRQRPQTEQSQGQRPQRRQHQLRAQTERQERQRPQRTRQQQRARAEQQHGQRAQVEPQRRQRVQQQRQRTQEEQQPRERAQPQRQRAQQLRLRAQQLRQKVQEEQQERQRALEEQQERQRAQAEQQERQRAQAEQRERQRAQAEQRERQRAQAEQQERQRAQEEQQERQRAQAEQRERQRAQAEQRERAQAEQQQQQQQQERRRTQAEPQERRRTQAEPQERRRTQAEPQEERQRPEERRLQPRIQTERRTSGFRCEGREYGYYPDVESDCQGYHICNPISMGGGSIQFHKYSFQCSPGMKWHQGSMACVAASTGDHICQIEDAVR